MIEIKKVKITFPKTLNLSPEKKDEVDRNLIVKKINKYGFFDKDGKWKEK